MIPATHCVCDCYYFMQRITQQYKIHRQNFLRALYIKVNQCNEYIRKRLLLLSFSPFLLFSFNLIEQIDKLIERQTHTMNSFQTCVMANTINNNERIILCLQAIRALTGNFFLLSFFILICLRWCVRFALIHTFSWDQFIIRIEFRLVFLLLFNHPLVVSFYFLFFLKSKITNHKIEHAHTKCEANKQPKKIVKEWS